MSMPDFAFDCTFLSPKVTVSLSLSSLETSIVNCPSGKSQLTSYLAYQNNFLGCRITGNMILGSRERKRIAFFALLAATLILPSVCGKW